MVANVMDFGAKANGKADDSNAFRDAMNSLAATGGTLFVPVGLYAVNFILDVTNVQMLGESCSAPPAGNRLVPFDHLKPVVSVGTDRVTVQDARLVNLALRANGPNGTGNVGLAIGGGARQMTAASLSLSGFKRNCVTVVGGSLPVAYVRLQNLDLQADSSGCDAIVRIASGPTYVGAIYMDGLFFHGDKWPNGGHTLIIDDVQASISNSWMQAHDGRGISMLHTHRGTPEFPEPRLRCSCFDVDSDNSNDVLVETWQTSPAEPPLVGIFGVDGCYRTIDGVKTRFGGFHFGYLPTSSYPVAYGNQYVSKPGVSPQDVNTSPKAVLSTDGKHLILKGEQGPPTVIN